MQRNWELKYRYITHPTNPPASCPNIRPSLLIKHGLHQQNAQRLSDKHLASDLKIARTIRISWRSTLQLTLHQQNVRRLSNKHLASDLKIAKAIRIIRRSALRQPVHRFDAHPETRASKLRGTHEPAPSVNVDSSSPTRQPPVEKPRLLALRFKP